MKIFAQRLLELRHEKGISQAQLAKDLNLSYAIICFWENDKSEPTAPNIVKLADYFNVSTDYLLGKKDY